jgi:hypothetical protein
MISSIIIARQQKKQIIYGIRKLYKHILSTEVNKTRCNFSNAVLAPHARRAQFIWGRGVLIQHHSLTTYMV